MARKTVSIKISDAGRDAGKTFVITEMSAESGERFAARALLALTSSGAEVPDGIGQASMATMAAFGMKAFLSLDYDRISPLLTEMMSYVQIDMGGGVVRPIIEGCGDVEEVPTLLKLRKAFLELHLGFSIADLTQTSGLASAAKTDGS